MEETRRKRIMWIVKGVIAIAALCVFVPIIVEATEWQAAVAILSPGALYLLFKTPWFNKPVKPLRMAKIRRERKKLILMGIIAVAASGVLLWVSGPSLGWPLAISLFAPFLLYPTIMTLFVVFAARPPRRITANKTSINHDT